MFDQGSIEPYFIGEKRREDIAMMKLQNKINAIKRLIGDAPSKVQGKMKQKVVKSFNN